MSTSSPVKPSGGADSNAAIIQKLKDTVVAKTALRLQTQQRLAAETARRQQVEKMLQEAESKVDTFLDKFTATLTAHFSDKLGITPYACLYTLKIGYEMLQISKPILSGIPVGLHLQCMPPKSSLTQTLS